MKMYRNPVTRLARVVKVGAALGTAILATSALQLNAQSAAPYAGQGASTPTIPSEGTSAPISHQAKEFIKEAAEANQTEIAMANVAQSKSQNTEVKALAQMILTDHQQNYAQLQAIAQSHGVALKTSPDWMDNLAVKHLQKANDANFDQEYTKAMIKDHVKCINKFDTAIADIQETDVKQYAESTLPALRKHLRHSEDTARAVGVDESTIASLVKDLPSEDRGVTVR